MRVTFSFSPVVELSGNVFELSKSLIYSFGLLVNEIIFGGLIGSSNLFELGLS